MKIVIIFIFLVFITACKQETVKEISVKDDVSSLASQGNKEGETNVNGEHKAAVYISERFKAIGLLPKGTDGFYQSFSLTPQPDQQDDMSYGTRVNDILITGTNVVGFIDNKAKNTVIIGARYDHAGNDNPGFLYDENDKTINNDVDDYARGVAVLLNLAVKLKDVNTKNNYVFIAFSDEGKSSLGPNYFVENPTIDIRMANYMISMDIFERLKMDRTLAVNGIDTSPRFKQVLNAANKNFNLIDKEPEEGSSDHTSFYVNVFPILHFSSDQPEDYQKPSSATNKLNYVGMELISDLIFDVISELDTGGKLTFSKTNE